MLARLDGLNGTENKLLSTTAASNSLVLIPCSKLFRGFRENEEARLN